MAAAVKMPSSDDARKPCSPAVLALVGTLLVHALFLQSLMRGTGVLGIRLPQSALTLVVIESTHVTESTVKRIDASTSRILRRRMSGEIPMRLPIVDIGEQLQTEDVRASASLVDENSFMQLCRRTYPDDVPLQHDLAGVSIRSPVMPGGRIGPADIQISSGDAQRARLALRCLQAFGTVGPVI